MIEKLYKLRSLLTMQETNPLDNYNEPITYFGIAYTLTKEDNDRLNSLDANIQERLKDVLYLSPYGSRHITIMNLTSVVDGYEDHDVIQFIESNVGLYRDRLRAIASSLDPFEVRLTRLQVGSGAIILRGEDQGQISKIRDELMDLPRLGGRIIDSGFIHSTQARYKKRILVSDVREQLKSVEVDVPITVDRIGIVRADVCFSRPHTIVEEFDLGSKN
ncbi:MAG TPA: hypothetical protein VLG36_00855 [Candidatus Chromulinivoraceae bacterium]|nr:hypothetical protein [Candidatus Chromulinivoraceae bacterium]